MNWLKSKLCACLAVLLFTISLRGAEYFVSTNGSDSADGTSWETAFKTIHKGVDTAIDNDIIWLADGNFTLTGQVSIVKGVALKSLNGATNTFINGAYSGFRGFFIGHPDALLDGLTITNFYVGSQLAGDDRYGAGIYMTNGIVQNCIISGNTLKNYKDNAAYTGYGAGIAMSGGILQNSTISHNNLLAERPNYGGGVYIDGSALVRHCVVEGNIASADRYNASSSGGGIYLSDGTVQNCVIRHNQATGDFPKDAAGKGSGYGGGVYQSGGVMENCLVIGNESFGTGGGVYMDDGILQYCTISKNKARQGGCGLYKKTSGTVSNSVIWDNMQFGYYHYNTYAVNDVTVNSGTYPVYSCASELTSGTGNISEDPLFRSVGDGYGVELVGGDFRLGLASPCIDAAMADVSVTNDVAGDVRPQFGAGAGVSEWDMGAYELADVTNGVLRCDLNASPRLGIDSLDVPLTAYVAGANTNITSYTWDYTDDGITDVSGINDSHVTNTYGVGVYSVSLTVFNDENESATYVRTNHIYVAPEVAYVCQNGSATFPYDTWEKAADNIQDAVNVAERVGTDATLVLVSNGTYVVSTQIGISKGIKVKGLNGASKTVIDCDQNWRGFYLGDEDAVLDGVTVMNGKVFYTDRRDQGRGGGIYISAGTVQNCIVSNCVAAYDLDHWGLGGGVYMDGGVLQNSTIVGNTAVGYKSTRAPKGAGVYQSGDDSLVQNCVIMRNESQRSGFGGGVCIERGTLRNCLVAGNSAGRYGGGVYMYAGATESCTVTRNMTSLSTALGGGVYRSGGTVLNSIVYANSSSNAPLNIADDANVSYSCAPELISGTGNISDPPLFINGGDGYGLDFTNGNYGLRDNSSCIDAGLNQNWMNNAVDIDGEKRIIRKNVDIGAYETASLGTYIILF